MRKQRVKTVNFEAAESPQSVTIATSLGLPRNSCKFCNPHTYVYQRWNFGEDRSIVGEIFGEIGRFLRSRPKRCIYYPRNLRGYTGQIFVIFAQNVANIIIFIHYIVVAATQQNKQQKEKYNILPLNIFESEWRYCKPFSNVTLPNERIYLNFAIKSIAMATSLEESEKRSG